MKQLLSFVLIHCCLAALLALIPIQELAAQSSTLSERWALNVSGLHRTRYSYLENQFRPGLSGNDEALSLHTLVLVEASKGAWTVAGELQDARDYLNDSNSALSTIEINTLEPLQAYVNYHRENVFQDGAEADVKLGRFTLNLGSRRVVARHLFRNTIQNYTGLSTRWRSNTGQGVESFWVMPVSINPSDKAGLLANEVKLDEEDPDLQFWGIFYQAPDFFRNVQLQLYVFGLHEQDDAGEKQTADREIYTPGIRFLQAPAVGQWDLDIEYIYQFGSRRATAMATDTRTLDVAANFKHVSAGYTFEANWQPRLSVEYDSGSGDEGNQENLKFSRYDGLFGPRREFGPTGLYGILGRENIKSRAVKLSFAPSSRLDAYFSFRNNSLDSGVDRFASSGVIDPLGLSGTNAGDQWEFRARYWLIENILRVELGGALFRKAEFFDSAPNANNEGNPQFIYSDITWRF